MTITVVCGAPCSGKTTHVEQHARPGDVVVDFDAIARERGSPDDWQHREPYKSAAQHEMARRIDALDGENAWVIRMNPRVAASLADALDGTLLVLDPSEAVCLRRAANRPSGTRRAIRMWYWQRRADESR